MISILNAMQEYHSKTCIRFRPYSQTDLAWIDIKQDWSGCWSSVGMKSEGQVVNLGSEKCRQQGVVIHELMHAIGFVINIFFSCCISPSRLLFKRHR